MSDYFKGVLIGLGLILGGFYFLMTIFSMALFRVVY